MELEGAEPGGVPLILRCPRGEEWPATNFRSYIDSKAKVQTHETITFECPAGHSFTLLRAVRSGMLTQEKALKLIWAAQGQLPGLRVEVRRARREWARRDRKPVKGGKPDGA